MEIKKENGRKVDVEIREKLEGKGWTAEGYKGGEEVWTRVRSKREHGGEDEFYGISEDCTFKFEFKEYKDCIWMKVIAGIGSANTIKYELCLTEIAEYGGLDWGENKEGMWIEIENMMLGTIMRIDRIKF